MHLVSMTTTHDPHSRRRLIAVLAAGVTVLVLIGIGIYGLLAGPVDTPTQSEPTPSPENPVPTQGGLPQIPPIEASTDPETFARNAAHALFTWDAASGFMPLDYQAVILDVGDPTGAEQAGLVSDVSSYLPTREAWTQLRQYATTQHLSIEDAYLPEAWTEAVEQAQPGQLPVGATAITIEGTRYREGLWNNEHTETTHPVAFTIFLACPSETGNIHQSSSEQPSNAVYGGNDVQGHSGDTGQDGSVESCYLLRLSVLDQPLR